MVGTKTIIDNTRNIQLTGWLTIRSELSETDDVCNCNEVVLGIVTDVKDVVVVRRIVVAVTLLCLARALYALIRPEPSFPT